MHSLCGMAGLCDRQAGGRDAARLEAGAVSSTSTSTRTSSASAARWLLPIHVSRHRLFLTMRNGNDLETTILEDGRGRVAELLPPSWEANLTVGEGRGAGGGSPGGVALCSCATS